MSNISHESPPGAFCGPAAAFAASRGYVASSAPIQTAQEAFK